MIRYRWYAFIFFASISEHNKPNGFSVSIYSKWQSNPIVCYSHKRIHDAFTIGGNKSALILCDSEVDNLMQIFMRDLSKLDHSCLRKFRFTWHLILRAVRYFGSEMQKTLSPLVTIACPFVVRPTKVLMRWPSGRGEG